MRFLISASGTGGHVFPAKEFSKECIKNNHEVIWIGTKTGIENKVINKDILFCTLSMRGFRGKNLIYKILSLLTLISSTFKSIYYLKKYNIDYVICFGGYISLPVGLSAWFCRKPLFLHEQNAVMGTSNKLLKKFSKIIFLGFSLNQPLSNKMELVGNPIRKLNENSPLNLNKQTNRIYVTGGSQGSEFINSIIPIALNSLDIQIEVRHQSGVGKATGIKELYSSKISVEVVEFYENPQESILWSDFVISRAGALSLSEAISLKKGLMMIPLPSSIDDHQLFNALNIKHLSMGLIHEESESTESLSTKLQNIIDTKLYIRWSEVKNDFDHFQAAERMLISILKS
ncbi:MAG: UDP-N-acetylglucosamine--N-acetylmuramyl-(pentapeptide) pyrophosphoryl-undecaprenol N-acetylglucosamine transferase [Gammaproteobacteria bacterium]|nr:UDP-N-acetylglucosamine--N-acetylmuramyl-(pentapeptide) pyrophosphoryl-undecaprenol N-acetylglucosamine transferase [Gammaproteobacteria bacterium]